MGQIISKGDRKWLLRVFVGSETINGKRKRKYVGEIFEGTFAQAKDEMKRREAKVADGEFVSPTTQTLSEFLDHWLDHVKSGSVSEATLSFYRSKIRILRSPLGSLKPSKLDKQGLQRFVSELSAEGYAPATVRHVIGALKDALESAVEYRLIPRNPAAGLKLPRRVSEERIVWDAKQVAAFLTGTADHPLHALWHLLLYTGMRPGEAFGLKWTDLSGDRITIQRAVVEVRPEVVERSDGRRVKRLRYALDVPKTEKSRRTIPLPKETIEALQHHRQRQVKEMLAAGTGYRRQDFIFAIKKGDHWTIQPVANRWETAVKRSGLPVMSIYGCRHTHATLLLKADATVKVVSERLGHASIVLTLNTYQHVLPSMQDEAVSRLSALFRTAER